MENTAKNFALQLGSLISLYVSITALITLLFGIITLQYPDAANGYWEQEGAMSGIRFSIAMLIVFFPAYIALTRMVNVIRRTEQGMYLTLTKWLIYISLLIGGAAILGDLVSVVNAFLNGELTIRFVLKALVFLLVIGSAFVYYVRDARGHWQSNEKGSVMYAGVMAVVVLSSVVFGYMQIENPSQVREMKLDTTQVNDLMNIQYHIEEYHLVNETLPSDIETAFNGISVPEASEERDAYKYSVVDENSYTLCAEFAYESTAGSSEYSYYGGMEKGMVSWEHGKGEWCYERTIPETEVFLR